MDLPLGALSCRLPFIDKGKVDILLEKFLAAMSSSRSDVVTQFVRPSVRPFMFPSPFFSFSVLEVSSSP